MKKIGMVLMIIGVLLILLQMLSMIGNARLGNPLEFTGDFAYDAGLAVGYFFVGTQGIIAFVVGLILHCKGSGKDND